MSEANTTTNHRPVPSTATMKGLPDYLRALLASDAPSAQAKLLAAWDGYSVETQILILADFHAREAYVPLELAEKALASPNAYVRHLAATAIDPIAWHEATSDTEVFSLLERIRNDPDPLVRCAPSHWQRGQEDKPTAEDLDAFLALPFPERCASLGAWALGAAGPVPSAFSLLLHRAVETHALSEHELVEMVHEYLAAPKNTEFTREPPYDGFDDLLASQALDTLWNLVPDMPHPVAVALIQRLPISTGGLLGGEAPEELIGRLSDDLLESLLLREDVVLDKVRRNMVLEREMQDGFDRLIWAAAGFHFNPTDEEFDTLRRDPERLKLLAHGRDLSLVVLSATADALADGARRHGKHWYSLDRSADDFLRTLDQRRERLAGEQLEAELCQVSIYQLAAQLASAVELRTPERPPYCFVVRGDKWGTYLALRRKWKREWNDILRERAISVPDSSPEADGAKEDDSLTARLLSMEQSLQRQESRLGAVIAVVVLLLAIAVARLFAR